MDENAIRKIVREEIANSLTSPSNFTIPRHTHNGSDMTKINSYDVNTANPQGFVFRFNQDPNNTKTVYITQDFQNDRFQILSGGSPALTTLDIATFKSINLIANGISLNDKIVLEFVNSPIISTILVDKNSVERAFIKDTNHKCASFLNDTGESYVIENPTDDFSIQLPISAQPTPLEGMISYANTGIGSFKAVDDSGSFKFIPLSDGTTTGSTIPTGTVTVTINGTDYNLLFA